MKYSAVLFDAADTLFTTQGTVGEIYGSIAREFGSTAAPEDIQAAFLRQFRNSGPLTSDSERQWWKEIVLRVFSEVGMVEEFDRFFDRVYEQFQDSRGWRLFPETRDVLEELKRRRVRMGVISNFDSRLYSVMESLKVRSYFEAVTISSEVGHAKPQREIFDAAVRAMAVSPKRTLFVGDSLTDDYQAGERAGLHTLLIDRTKRYAGTPSIRRIESLLEILSPLPQERVG